MTAPAKIMGINAAWQARQVRIGRLWHDPSNVEHLLHRYSKHIFILTGDEQFPYQFFGSGTAVNVAGRHILFCCGHQISQFKPDDVGMRHSSTNTIMTASRLLFPVVTDENRDTDWIDARGLEYDVEKYATPYLTSEFFLVDERAVWPTKERGHFIVFGYPSARQDIDYNIPHITARSAQVTAVYDGPSHSPYVHRIRMDRKETFDADGMSGGAVFYIGGNAGSYFIGFAGMIIRGGKTSDFLHFVEAKFLCMMAKR